MKVNLAVRHRPGTWSEAFKTGMVSALSYAGLKVNVVELPKELNDAPECDVWFIAEHKDPLRDTIAKLGPTVAYAHGSEVTGSFLNVVLSEMGAVPKDTSDGWPPYKALLTALPRYANQISEAIGIPAHAVGFPLHIDPVEGGTQIVVPGRLNPEKQPTLLAEALYPWRDRVVFCSGASWHTGSEEIARYLRGRGFRVRTNIPRDVYFREELSRARVVVTAGMFETLNLGIAEAGLAGVPVVAPFKFPYSDYLLSASLYEPYSIRSIRGAVRGSNVAWIKRRIFSPEEVGLSIKAVLEEVVA